MKNITGIFSKMYIAKKALVIYELVSGKDVYVESYDMDSNSRPINAHPLSVEESAVLAACLQTSQEANNTFLSPKGLLPKNVAYLHAGSDGYAVWVTPVQKRNLFFKEQLDIPCGEACLPALIWKANRSELQLFALAGNAEITPDTTLYHAPFFNVFPQGNVCMGTVDIDIENDCYLEDFIQQWEGYFLNSYFSHMVASHLPVKGNMVQLWQEQVGTGRSFPMDVLLKTGKKIQHLIQ